MISLARLSILLLLGGLSACVPPKPFPPQHRPHNPKEAYVGLPKHRAIALANLRGRKWRVTQEDGRRFPVTMDYRPGRLNFKVRHGKVVQVTRG